MTLTKIDEKQDRILNRDPKTLKPHPVSATLYLDGNNSVINGHPLTHLEAANEIMERMDVNDIIDNIRQWGILVPLVITEDNIIISGTRRWKASMQLQLPSVPVEVKTFPSETEEQRAVVDYNRTRNKTESQKMKEADLYKEIIGKLASERMMAGKLNSVPNLAQGSKDQRKTNTVIGSLLGKGK